MMRNKTTIALLVAMATTQVAMAPAALAGDRNADKDHSNPARIMGFGGVCTDCDLSKKDLSGARLTGASFPRAKFIGTDLRDSVISGSNFARAVFQRADLTDSRLSGANLAWSEFDGATLDNVSASAINLSHATLNGAQARNVVFSSSNLTYATLVGGDFRDTEFDGCNLAQADFSSTRLSGTRFGNSDISQSRFGNADLDDANFKHVSLRNADFGNARMNGAELDQVYLAGADLSQVRGLKQSQLENACGDATTRLPHGMKVQSCDKTDWARDFQRKQSRMSYTIDIDQDDIGEIHAQARQAIEQGRQAIREAGLALAQALQEADDKGDFEFHYDVSRDSAAMAQQRNQRDLSRAIQTLSRLKLENRNAQAQLDKAVAQLEKAQKELQKQSAETELAGK